MLKNIDIRSSKFPIMTGEKEELVNPGMYGKALSIYLQEELKRREWNVPFFCCEDWGWWVEVKAPEITMGIRIYTQVDYQYGSDLPDKSPSEYLCEIGFFKDWAWSWRKFRSVDTRPCTQKLLDELLAIFKA